MEMAFITNLAYTYRNSGQEIYQISPYYYQSLIHAMDWRSCVTEYASQWKRVSYVLRTSKILKEYLVMEEMGGISYNPEIRGREYHYSKYRVTDKLKELASSLSDGYIFEVEVGDIARRAKVHEHLPCMKERRLYIVETNDGEEKEFSLLIDARRWCEEHENKKEPVLVQTPNRLVRMSTVKKHTYNEIHEGNTKAKRITKKHENVSASNTVIINREEIYNILKNPSSGLMYSHYVMSELFRMYDETTNENPEICLEYFQSKQGRHYVQGSAIQLFPKELRDRVLSEYVAVDMECSIFSLYKNLGKKFGYKKETPQIDEIIRDRRAYRERFVSSRLPYEGVKTVLTAIAYGAIVDVYNMYMSINEGWRCFRRSSLLNCGYDKTSVMNMCNTDEIQALVKELRSLGRFIISKCTNKEKKCIVNLCGNALSLKTRKNFGTKMAHVYQSYEAAILMELRNVEIGNIPLGCIKNGIGLFLHDGMYVHKNIIKKYDLCKMFSQRIKEVFNFDISYEVE